MPTPPSCYSCEQEHMFSTLPPRERVAADSSWRVAHVFNTALPGWLVLLPRRHVLTVAELTAQEAAGLGTWQVYLSRALQAVTGCVKTYVLAFGEAEGYPHLHFHVVPRMSDLAENLRGPGIFGLLDPPADVQMTSTAMNEIALAVRQQLPTS